MKTATVPGLQKAAVDSISASKLNLFKNSAFIIMWFAAVLFVFPFLWMLSSSFKIEADIFKYPIDWIPRILPSKTTCRSGRANMIFSSIIRILFS